MKFFQACSFALFFLASTSFGASVPQASGSSVDNGQDSAVDIFSTLKSSTDTILPQIATLVQSGNASEANLEPLMNELTTALKTASSSLAPLVPSSEIARRQLNIAGIVSTIFTDLADGLATILGISGVPGVSTLIANAATALDDIISIVQLLLPDAVAGLQLATGILNLISKVSKVVNTIAGAA
ncbi:hypothetical protein BDP27DRAFT_1403800 [Rhodocollybia butyracea]|uniref:Uncharacterized protein n=1 Tax=Rhodocollybia butyracea TaxID=206335 RepID=A0A9P5PQB6_9AGAR|nr:hypothetical protein BDP27DRAFT_1403800 [Rhodocollybia butyracea]